MFAIILGSSAHIAGVTVQNGKPDEIGNGGGIKVLAGTLTLTNVAVSGNTSGLDGGGVYNGSKGSMTITSSTINNNSTGIAGSGGGVSNNGTLTLTNVAVGGNTSGFGGGGVYNGRKGSMTITNSSISDNSTSNLGNGGGIDNRGTLTLTDSILGNNSAAKLGGGFHNNSKLDIVNSTLSDNQAGKGGGGIFNDEDGTLTLRGSTVRGNSAPLGGGIYNESKLEIADSTISDNEAEKSGGGITNTGGTLALTGSTVTGNEAKGNGGGIVNAKGGTVTLTGSAVGDNTAEFGGGGIYNKEGTVMLTDSTVTGNEAEGGGGIYNDVGTVTLIGGTVSDNTVGVGGGGIFNKEGTVILTGTTVTSNEAEGGGGIYNKKLGTVTLTDSAVTGNSAPLYADIRNAGGTVTSKTTKADAGSPGPATGALTGISQLDRLDFTQPLIIKGLASGDFRVLRLSEDKVHTHIAGMNQVFEQLCPLMADHSITTVATNSVIYGKDGKGLQRSLEQGLIALGEASKSGNMADIFQAITAPGNRMAFDVSNAQKDALILITAYRCDSPVVVTFYRNMGKFVKDRFATTATVPLNKSDVAELWWSDMQTTLRVPRTRRDFISKQVYEVMTGGQMIIRCSYGPSDPVKQVGFVSYTFWYESVPDNLIDMLSSVPSGTHPMWRLGLNSVTACPDSPEAANKVRRAGMIP